MASFISAAIVLQTQLQTQPKQVTSLCEGQPTDYANSTFAQRSVDTLVIWLQWLWVPVCDSTKLLPATLNSAGATCKQAFHPPPAPCANCVLKACMLLPGSTCGCMQTLHAAKRTQPCIVQYAAATACCQLPTTSLALAFNQGLPGKRP